MQHSSQFYFHQDYNLRYYGIEKQGINLIFLLLILYIRDSETGKIKKPDEQYGNIL